MSGDWIQSFNSLEEMLLEQRRNEAIAIQNTTPDQWGIGWGDYFKYEAHYPGESFTIYGRIYTREEFIQAETDLGGDDEFSKQELEEIVRNIDESYERGYRFGEHFSIVTPAGELGSTHVSVMTPITQEEFESARQRVADDG